MGRQSDPKAFGRQTSRLVSHRRHRTHHTVFIQHLMLWRSASSPDSQMSSSESSLLEEQMQEKRRSCREWSTPRRVQRYSDLISREGRDWYVLLSTGSFYLITSPDSTRSFSGGQAGLFLPPLLPVTADRDDAAYSVACMTSKTNLYSRSMTAMFSTTPADLKPAVEMNCRLYKISFIRRHGRDGWRIDCTRYGSFPLSVYSRNSNRPVLQVLHSDGQ